MDAPSSLVARYSSLVKLLAHDPWFRRLSRLLTLAAGVLLVLGPLWPWAYVPFGGLRLPLYALFGPGGLLLVGGAVLLLHPRPAPLLLLLIAGAAAWAALALPPQMLAKAQSTTGTVDGWLDPLNQLLSRFRITEIRLTDWSLPAARAIGPGVPITLWGAGLAAAAAAARAVSTPLAPPAPPRSCPSCASPLPRYRQLRFCTVCGTQVSPVPICSRCQSAAEGGDRFCGQCGEPLV